MSVEAMTAIMISSLLVMMLLGYPIALVIGGLSAFFGLVFVGPQIMPMFMSRLYSTFANYILIAIPLFVFMGVVIEKAGISGMLYDAMYQVLGRLRGGLAIATVVACTIFAAATGVIGASVVTMGLFALPNMLRYNYNKPIATGALCAGGTLGILIPPSIMIVMYGPMAGLSVGRLFMAAFVPGILLSILYITYILIRCYRNPELGPVIPKDKVLPLKEKMKLVATSILPVSLLILAVLGSIFFGLAAPTEAAGIGAFAAVLLAAMYKKLSFSMIRETVYRTMRVSCMLYLVLIGAGFFAAVFIRIGGMRVVRNVLLGLPFPNWGILLTMWLIIFVMGKFIDWIGILMLVVPLFTPIGQALGYDPIWFAMMIMVVMQTTFLTPPFAYAIFYLKGVAPPEVSTGDIYRGVYPFILLQVIGIILLSIFPNLILWLPNIMYR